MQNTELFMVDPPFWVKTDYGYKTQNTLIKYKIYTMQDKPPYNLHKPFAVFSGGKPHCYTDTLEQAKKWVNDDYFARLACHGIRPIIQKENN